MPVAVPRGTLVAPDGTVVSKPAVVLDAEDSALWIAYAQYLRSAKLGRKVYCHDCHTFGTIETTDHPVTDEIQDLLWMCQCRMMRATLSLSAR